MTSQTAELLRLQQELALEKYKVQMDMYKAQIEAQAGIYTSMLGQESKKRVIPMTANTVISTEVVLEDGRKLTVSMDSAKCAKIDPDIHEIFYDTPCMVKKETTPRSMAQLQECPCAMCQTACATILKWRILR